MRLRLDHERLSEMLRDFHSLSQVRIVIYDSNFQKVAAYPEHSSAFCSLLKQNPEFKQLCRRNEAEACAICRRSNSLYIYQCHAGLCEAVAPIKMNDVILGYIMFGQLRRDDGDDAHLLDYAARYTTDQALLESSFCKLKTRNDRQIKAIAGIMQACTSYLWINEMIRIDGENCIYLLTDYINQNLEEDLSVDALCSVLKVSRVKLYEIAHEYYGMSIAKYIRKKRISEAAKLLGEVGCSVREAAMRVGFYDYNYFSKAFKREMSLTPHEYKRMHYKHGQGEPHPPRSNK